MAEETGGSGRIQPQGEALRSALRWLDDRVRDDPALDRSRLVSEAALRYDLSPLEEDFLLRSWVRP